MGAFGESVIHRENQVLEEASRALASFVDLAKAAAVELLCSRIALVSLTKPFQKGWSCQDSKVLFGKVL